MHGLSLAIHLSRWVLHGLFAGAMFPQALKPRPINPTGPLAPISIIGVLFVAVARLPIGLPFLSLNLDARLTPHGSTMSRIAAFNA
jgi:hypothetical protein